jgi:hypothetical protein
MKPKNKKLFIIFILIGIIFCGFILYQIITTYKAHETFAGYCEWRGLVVINQSTDYGWCKDSVSGKEFKMVLVDNRWYLDGDLPNGWPF